MAVFGSAALLEVEINAGLEVFKLLEPEVQKGFIALFHLFHHKQQQVSAAQFLTEAATELRQANAAQPAAQRTTGSAAGKDLASTSLNPDLPSTG
jgi:hypothetical protein